MDYDTRGGAGIAYLGGFDGSPVSGGLVYLSIGFETIYPEEKRNDIMVRIMEYLDGPIASVDGEIAQIPKKLKNYNGI